MRKNYKVLFALLVSLLLFVGCSTLFERYETELERYETEPFKYMQSVEIINKRGFSSWKFDYYVDDFKNKTDTAYVKQSNNFTKGNFSNSATNYSPAYAEFLVNRDSIYLELYEYNSYFPVTASSSDKAHIKIQTDDGNVIDLGSFGFTFNNKRILINNKILLISSLMTNPVKQLFEAFVTSPTVKMRIEVKSSFGSSSIYNFSIPTNGFEEMYHNAFIGE